eukprot:TRINITY_DN62052_c0_g1_i1.p1 TRINITY_DN62052_c0_g1~~TRINITY_DN62052_c0_g1_i1.p1  ORF type:complete len:563 (-),score=71.38 TRINITY_DN62052_c0_g1_i1:182-1870(-)
MNLIQHELLFSVAVCCMLLLQCGALVLASFRKRKVASSVTVIRFLLNHILRPKQPVYMLRAMMVTAALACVVCISFYCAFIVVRALIAAPRLLTFGQDCIVISAMVTSTLIVGRPCLLGSATAVYSWYSWLMLLCIVFPMLADDASTMLYGSMILFFPRLILSLACGHVVVVAFWSTSILIAVCATTILSAPEFEALATAHVYMAFEALGSVCTIVCTGVNGAWMEAAMAAQTSQISTTAALLEVMSDAVVELDMDGKLINDAPRLAATLLHDSKKCLKGISFDSYIPDAFDKDKFVKQVLMVEQASATVTMGACSLSLADSSSNKLAVDIYRVSFAGIDGRLRHIVGISEDKQAWAGVQQVGLAASSADPIAVAGDLVPSLTFDATTFHVLACARSLPFEQGEPCLPGICFRDWLAKDDVTNDWFFEELRLGVAALLQEDRIGKRSWSSAMVVQPPKQNGRSERRFEVKSHVTIQLALQDVSAEADDSTTVSADVGAGGGVIDGLQRTVVAIVEIKRVRRIAGRRVSRVASSVVHDRRSRELAERMQKYTQSSNSSGKFRL